MHQESHSSILFYEVQRFRQLSIWLILISVSMLFGLIFYWQIILGVPVGNRPVADYMVILLWLVGGVALPVFFYVLKMVTIVDGESITIHFAPLHKTRIILQEIAELRVKKYEFLDYGGYGIRNGALNVSGNVGVELVFKNGEKLLIGSQRSKELAQSISTAMIP